MLEKLLTSKTRVKILNHLFFYVDESHIREIADKLKIPVSGVKREIDNLEKTGVIKKTKTKISLNNKCSFLDDLRNIFIKTDGIVYPLTEAFEKIKGVNFVLIFGSFARGDYIPDSDVDLMVIGDMKLSVAYKLLKPVENKIKKDINPVIWKLDEFKKKKNERFAKEIFANKFIMIKGEENELRRTIKR